MSDPDCVETDSESYYTGEEESNETNSGAEDDWRDSSEEEEAQDLSQLGATATCIKNFKVKSHSSTIITTESGRQQQQSCQMNSGALVPSSGLDIENRPGEFPSGKVIQYNISQTYNLQQFGDVTVEGARNLNIGGTQNIATKSGPSQEEEEKPLTTTQKIRRRTALKIKAWTKDMVRTQGLTKVLDKIHRGASWVTIRGCPGEGKTTVAYMALEELSTEGRQVFQVISPKEFTEVIMTYSRPVIMLDDIFGDLEFDETEWLRWKSALKQCVGLEEHRSHEQEQKQDMTCHHNEATVILVGRNYVLKSASSDMGRLSDFVTKRHYVVDMTNTEVRKQGEKLDLWNAIITKNGIKIDDHVIRQICQTNTNHGFPHVCKLFAQMHREKNEIDTKDFFRSPLQFLDKTIKKFMKNSKILQLFVEMIKRDGKVSVRELGHLKHRFGITQAANDLNGSYLNKEGDYFMFNHPSIYDCVAFNICELNPLLVIENCNLYFIYQRLRLQSGKLTREGTGHSSDQSGLVVYVPWSYAEDLAKRFATEVGKGNLFHVFSHKVCSDEMFVIKLMSHITQPFIELFNLNDRKTEYNFLSLIASNKSATLLKYIHRTKGSLTENETRTILFGVCRFAAADALSYLIQICDKIDMNAQSETERLTPLMIATQSTDERFVHQVMSLECDLNVCDKWHKKVFHYLCQNGHVSAVEKLIDAGTDMNVKNMFGWSGLWYACERNHEKVVKLLVDRGVEIDAEALGVACAVGNLDVVKYLFAKGATVDKRTGDGYTPLHFASAGCSLEVLRFLIENWYFVNCETKTTPQPLLMTCTDVNVKSKIGQTPLHSAAKSGTKECIQVLLKAGADVNALDKEGHTPLHNAVEGDSKECAEVLLKAGADANVPNNWQSTYSHQRERWISGSRWPLFQQIISIYQKLEEGGFIRSLITLLKAGADLNLKGTDGDTPLHRAAGRGSKECVKTLLNAGADTNVTNTSGQTPLHAVIRRGVVTSPVPLDVSICQSLIRHGADVNIQDKNGNTPLHMLSLPDRSDTTLCKNDILSPDAFQDYYRTLVKLLIDNGADINLQNNSGESSLPGWCKTLLTDSEVKYL